jgi:hypothetical protein
LKGLDWCATQVGADGASLRAWLEIDIGALGKRRERMQRTTRLLRMFAAVAVFGLATLALPLAAQARVRVSIGIGVPVYPAPVIVTPPPVVVYPAPMIVTQPPVVYGSSPVWVQGPSGHRHHHWRHHHHYKHRW